MCCGWDAVYDPNLGRKRLMYCNLEQRGDAWYCSNCDGRPLKGNYKRKCKLPGVGAIFARVLSRLHSQTAHGCNCRRWARKMDAWGPDGCRDRSGLIVAHVLREARKRDIRMAHVPVGMLPGARTYLRRLLGVAIRQAARVTRSQYTPPP